MLITHGGNDVYIYQRTKRRSYLEPFLKYELLFSQKWRLPTSRIFNKSSAVAEMDDRLATIGMRRKWGGAAVGG